MQMPAEFPLGRHDRVLRERALPSAAPFSAAHRGLLHTRARPLHGPYTGREEGGGGGGGEGEVVVGGRARRRVNCLPCTRVTGAPPEGYRIWIYLPPGFIPPPSRARARAHTYTCMPAVRRSLSAGAFRRGPRCGFAFSTCRPRYGKRIATAVAVAARVSREDSGICAGMDGCNGWSAGASSLSLSLSLSLSVFPSLG